MRCQAYAPRERCVARTTNCRKSPPVLTMIRPFVALALLLAVAACIHVNTPEARGVLLLGEVHDNGAGHAARAALLRERIEATIEV